tara:strand:- start:142 stop:471 length:330 start_codon:yes stop_codon:yes gene_type:complete
VVPVNRNNSNGYACEIKRTKPVSSTKIKPNTPTKENIMTFSKFDTQQQIEEFTPEPTATDLAEIEESYEPTAADLVELNAWLDEVESEVAEYAYEDYEPNPYDGTYSEM